MADGYTPLSHHELDITKTEGKPEIEPNLLMNDFNWKTIAFVDGGFIFVGHFQIMTQNLRGRPST